MQGKQYFQLEQSETAIIGAASRIFSAYVSTGRVTDANEPAFLQKSITLAMQLARTVEDGIQSDDETSK